MAEGIEKAELARITRARAMTEDATRLHGDGRFDSAIILYVTALEIIGEAMIRHLDLGKVIQSHSKLRKRQGNHQLRHFVAASVAMAVVATSNSLVPAAEIDFSGISFERKTFDDNGRQGSRWEIKGGNRATITLLHFITREDYSQTSLMHLLNIRMIISFWGQAAFGHCDNHRLSIIHMDNEFEFLLKYIDGTQFRSTQPNLEAISLWYAGVMPFIWDGLKNPNVTAFLRKHMQQILWTFAAQLTSDSYHYPA